MQYLVQGTDCSRLHFRLTEVTTSEIAKYLVPQLLCAKVVDGIALDGILLSSIESIEDLDAVLLFPSMVHKKAAFKNIKEWQLSGVPFLTLMADKVRECVSEYCMLKCFVFRVHLSILWLFQLARHTMCRLVPLIRTT